MLNICHCCSQKIHWMVMSSGLLEASHCPIHFVWVVSICFFLFCVLLWWFHANPLPFQLNEIYTDLDIMMIIELHTKLYTMYIFHHKFGEVLLWHKRTTQQAKIHYKKATCFTCHLSCISSTFQCIYDSVGTSFSALYLSYTDWQHQSSFALSN